MIFKSQNPLIQYRDDIEEIFALAKKDPVTGTVFCEDCIDILDQVSIALGRDFESANRYFIYKNDYVSQEINMKQLDCDQFVKILELYLKDIGELMPTYSLDYVKKVRIALRDVFYSYQEGQKGTIPLAQLSDFCDYCFEKCRGKPFMKRLNRKDYDFYSFLEDTVKLGDPRFKHYMLYLKKNQKELNLNDVIRILRMFLLIDLPGEINFPFLDTMKSQNNLTLMLSYLTEYYGYFKEFYKEYASIDEKRINYEHVVSYIREVLEEKIKLMDGNSNLLNFSEEARFTIYLDVFLFDYIGIDRDWVTRENKTVSLDLSQIQEFLRFLCRSVDNLDIIELEVEAQKDKEQSALEDNIYLKMDDMYQQSIDDLTQKRKGLKDKNERVALDKVLNILERDKNKFHQKLVKP